MRLSETNSTIKFKDENNLNKFISINNCNP